MHTVAHAAIRDRNAGADTGNRQRTNRNGECPAFHNRLRLKRVFGTACLLNGPGPDFRRTSIANAMRTEAAQRENLPQKSNLPTAGVG
jgi:hypothetical protein